MSTPITLKQAGQRGAGDANMIRAMGHARAGQTQELMSFLNATETLGAPWSHEDILQLQMAATQETSRALTDYLVDRAIRNLVAAAREGNLEQVRYYASAATGRPEVLGNALYGAAQGGHQAVIDVLLQDQPGAIQLALHRMVEGALYSHENPNWALVDAFRARGYSAATWEFIGEIAVRTHHVGWAREAVGRVLAQSLPSIFEAAAFSGEWEICSLVLDRDALVATGLYSPQPGGYQRYLCLSGYISGVNAVIPELHRQRIQEAFDIGWADAVPRAYQIGADKAGFNDDMAAAQRVFPRTVEALQRAWQSSLTGRQETFRGALDRGEWDLAVQTLDQEPRAISRYQADRDALEWYSDFWLIAGHLRWQEGQIPAAQRQRLLDAVDTAWATAVRPVYAQPFRRDRLTKDLVSAQGLFPKTEQALQAQAELHLENDGRAEKPAAEPEEPLAPPVGVMGAGRQRSMVCSSLVSGLLVTLGLFIAAGIISKQAGRRWIALAAAGGMTLVVTLAAACYLRQRSRCLVQE
jgi:hypothetical protein